MFSINIRDTGSEARTGILKTENGNVATPVFMPVGTCAAVKMLTPSQVEDTGTEIILANTYHLMLRPGTETVQKLGGIHTFSGWKRPLLTDSGGFQVFSLAGLNSVSDAGVEFRSHIDGDLIVLTPENVVKAQLELGSDIAMVLDECPPASASYGEVEQAVKRSVRWAEKSAEAVQGTGQVLFAVSQGGRFSELRKTCTRTLVDMDFPGYAVGGLSVGENRTVRHKVSAFTFSLLPDEKPRYMMGIGEPRDILDGVEMGCDMFDCVLPTRNGRNGCAFTYRGRLNIRNSRFSSMKDPVEAECGCYTCTHFSAGYLRHLFNIGEGLGPVLLSLHNITFFMRFMEDIRNSVMNGSFKDFKQHFLQIFYKGNQQ